MGENAVPPNKYKMSSYIGLLSHSVVSEFEVLSYPASKNIKLETITKIDLAVAKIDKSVAISDEAINLLEDAKKDGKVKYAILIIYKEYEEDVPGPRTVKERNEIYWDGSPVLVIVVIDGGGGSTSTVSDEIY